MGLFTIRLLRRLDPEKRLVVAAWLFWVSVVAGAASCVLLTSSWYEVVLMAISWGAITLTCADIILTADVRAEADG